MSAPGSPGSAALIRLVAAREASTRLRDRNFIIGSVVMVVLLLGIMGFQVAASSGGAEGRLGIVGDAGQLGAAVIAQGATTDVDVTVVEFDDATTGRAAVESQDVDGLLVDGTGDEPQLLVGSRDSLMESVVGSAVTELAVSTQLAEAGVELDVRPLEVIPLDGGEDDGEATFVALIGVALLYGLLILFAQFVAQGVVEEKSSRVVELLLSTMRPWQLLAGKILGLGALGLGQIVLVTGLGVGGALAFDLVDVPGRLIGTVLSVIAWFVLGYAFYAAIVAVAASLVSRQEDLASVLTPTMILLVAAFVVAIEASADPGGTLATVTGFVPGLSPLVMPVRQAAGEAAAWEVALSVLLMLVAIAIIVRVGGRVYAGALLRTGGRIKMREAMRAERA